LGAPQLQHNPADAARLDVWLFRTRLVKSRSLATKLILGGKIRLSRNGQTTRRLKPHVTIRPGDCVTFMRGTELLNIEMVAPGTRRGPSSEARELYIALPLEAQ